MQGIVPAPGDLVAGRFRVEAEIGRGGVGAVLRARDPSNNVVAIKVLLPEAIANPEAVPRFINEAKATRELVSPHAVRVLDFGTLDDGLPFMVMELLEGIDINTMVEQRGPLPIAEACDIIIDACDALAEAHARGMVHRDLKPANLFAARLPDGNVCIKVLDFGLSKISAQVRHAALTSTGAFLGSPHYMAPEQLKSAKGVDARADIWSLGVVLYELLSAKPPFDGRSFGQLFMEIVTKDPTPITQHRPDTPPGLVDVIGRCLMKEREGRYTNLAELTAALAAFASPRGVAAARRIGERGAPRAPAASVPELEVAEPPRPSVVAGPSKFAGTMLMMNAPPMPRPSAHVPPPVSMAPSGPSYAPAQNPVAQNTPSTQSYGAAPHVGTAPIPPGQPAAPIPRQSMQQPPPQLPMSRTPIILAIVGVCVVLLIVGVLLGVSGLRGH